MMKFGLDSDLEDSPAQLQQADEANRREHRALQDTPTRAGAGKTRLQPKDAHAKGISMLEATAGDDAPQGAQPPQPHRPDAAAQEAAPLTTKPPSSARGMSQARLSFTPGQRLQKADSAPVPEAPAPQPPASASGEAHRQPQQGGRGKRSRQGAGKTDSKPDERANNPSDSTTAAATSLQPPMQQPPLAPDQPSAQGGTSVPASPAAKKRRGKAASNQQHSRDASTRPASTSTALGRSGSLTPSNPSSNDLTFGPTAGGGSLLPPLHLPTTTPLPPAASTGPEVLDLCSPVAVSDDGEPHDLQDMKGGPGGAPALVEEGSASKENRPACGGPGAPIDLTETAATGPGSENARAGSSLVSKPLAARKPLQQGAQGQQQQQGPKDGRQGQGTEQGQVLQQQQQSGAKVNPFFMSVQDKKKLKQQQVHAWMDAPQALEVRQAEQEAARRAEEEAATAAASQATQRAEKAQTPAPVNPFFMARKRAATPSTAGTAGFGAPVGPRVLLPALAPIHVTQSSTQGSSSLGIPLVSSSSMDIDTSVQGGLAAQASDPVSGDLKNDLTGDLKLMQLRPPSRRRASAWLGSRQSVPMGDAVTSSKDRQTQPYPGLLVELAEHLASQARRAAVAGSGVAGQLYDLPSSTDILAQLQLELLQVQANAWSAHAHTAAALAATPVVSANLAALPAITVAMHQPLPEQQAAAAGKEGGATEAGKQRDALPWPAKYQPSAVIQLCGNAAPAAELRAWLTRWRDQITAEAEQQQGANPASETGKGGGTKGGADTVQQGKWPGKRKSPWLASDDDSFIVSDSRDSWDSLEGGLMPPPPSSDNALILSGPVGCGKTAAVFACAQELGFNVLEVNPGGDRTGAQLLRLIGEATQSQRLVHQSKAAQQQQGLGSKTPGTGLGNGKTGGAPGTGAATNTGRKRKAGAGPGASTQQKGRGGGRRKRRVLDDDSEELACSTDDSPSPEQTQKRGRGRGKGKGASKGKDQGQGSLLRHVTLGKGSTVAGKAADNAAATAGMEQDDDDDNDCLLVHDNNDNMEAGAVEEAGAGGSAPRQAATATLVLFEEADLLLEEDRGFLTALAALIADTKRPVILAINSAEPPPGLGSMGLKHLRFSRPDPDHLLRTAVLTCCAEGLGTDGRLRLSDLLPITAGAQGDVRACLGALELWVQPLSSPATPVPPGNTSTYIAPVPVAGQRPRHHQQAEGVKSEGQTGSRNKLGSTSREMEGEEDAPSDDEGLQAGVAHAEAVVAAASMAMGLNCPASIVQQEETFPSQVPDSSTQVPLLTQHPGASTFQADPSSHPAAPAAAEARCQQWIEYHAACEEVRGLQAVLEWKAAALDKRLAFFRPRRGRGRATTTTARKGAKQRQSTPLPATPLASDPISEGEDAAPAPPARSAMKDVANGRDEAGEEGQAALERVEEGKESSGRSDSEDEAAGSGSDADQDAGAEGDQETEQRQEDADQIVAASQQHPRPAASQQQPGVSLAGAADGQAVASQLAAVAATPAHAGSPLPQSQPPRTQSLLQNRITATQVAQAAEGEAGEPTRQTSAAAAAATATPGYLSQDVGSFQLMRAPLPSQSLFATQAQPSAADAGCMTQQQASTFGGESWPAETPAVPQSVAPSSAAHCLHSTGPVLPGNAPIVVPQLVMPDPPPPLPSQLPADWHEQCQQVMLLAQHPTSTSAAVEGAPGAAQPSHTSPLLQNPEVMRMARTSHLWSQLSDAHLLTVTRDLIPPMSGPCPTIHQSGPSQWAPLTVGHNTLLACSSPPRTFPRALETRAQAQGRPPVIADAVNDLLTAETSSNRPIQTALLQAQAVEGLGCDSCAPRQGHGQGLSIAQQAGWELATSLMQQSRLAALDASGHTSAVTPGSSLPGVGSTAAAGGGDAGAVDCVSGQQGSSFTATAAGVAGMARSSGASALAAANDALLYLGPSTCVQGPGHGAIDRVSALGAICRAEALRMLELSQSSVLGRGRRALRFVHALQHMDMPETMWPQLAALATFGVPPVPVSL